MMTANTFMTLSDAANALDSLLDGHDSTWHTLVEIDHSTNPLGPQFSFAEHPGMRLVYLSAIEENIWSKLEDGCFPGPGFAVGSIEGSSFEIAARAVLSHNAGGRAALELVIPERYQGSPQISPADARLLADHLLYLADLCERREEKRSAAPAYPSSANSLNYSTGDRELDDLLAELDGDEPPTEPHLTEAV